MTQTILTTRQAAQVLGLKPSTLEVWRCRGGGPTYCKFGRACRYRKEDLEKFIRDSKRENTSE
jgi:excisionase family DNA binding protein